MTVYVCYFDDHQPGHSAPPEISEPEQVFLHEEKYVALNVADTDLLKKAYEAGFNASGEGYNGEGFRDENQNPSDNNTWVEDRDAALKTITG